MALRGAANPAGLIGEYLKSPDDLSKVVSLRRKLTREHATLSAKLKIGAKDQLEATREGLLQLQATRSEVNGIHEVFEQIESMFRDPLVEETGGRGATEETKGTRSFRTISEVRARDRATANIRCRTSIACSSRHRIRSRSSRV